MPPFRLHQRGQFIPMAAMVMLSVVVFMVGVVNVFIVSRAKLRAQNLADAAAMYVAGHMVQSINNAADKNEWMNLIYGDPNDPSYSKAGHDPCQPPGDPKKVPPGLGCFANHKSSFVFGDDQAAIGYANVINTVNQTQIQFQGVFNGLMGARDGVATNPNASALEANLKNAIPDFSTDPNVYVVVFNSAQGRNTANLVVNALDQTPKNVPPVSGVKSTSMQPITYDIIDVPVKFKLGFFGATKSTTLTQLMGGSPTGYAQVSYQSKHAWDGAGVQGEQIAAGSIVRVSVNLIGLSRETVQARAMAYVVMKSGDVGYNAKGDANPTYFVKLGKPV